MNSQNSRVKSDGPESHPKPQASFCPPPKRTCILGLSSEEPMLPASTHQGFHQNNEDGIDSNWLDSSDLFGKEPYLFGGSALSPTMTSGPGDSRFDTWDSSPQAPWDLIWTGTEMPVSDSGAQDPLSSKDGNSNAFGNGDWAKLSSSWDAECSTYESLNHRNPVYDVKSKISNEHTDAPLGLGVSTEVSVATGLDADSPNVLAPTICLAVVGSDVEVFIKVKSTMLTGRFVSKVSDIMAERLGTSASLLRIIYDGSSLLGDGYGQFTPELSSIEID